MKLTDFGTFWISLGVICFALAVLVGSFLGRNDYFWQGLILNFGVSMLGGTLIAYGMLKLFRLL